MSTQRDELAKAVAVIRNKIWGTDEVGLDTLDYQFADGLIAAGWTKPRTITTTEELDDLDADSVLRTKHGTLYTKGRDRDVLLSGVGWFTTSDAIAEEQSFTVLYEPQP